MQTPLQRLRRLLVSICVGLDLLSGCNLAHFSQASSPLEAPIVQGDPAAQKLSQVEIDELQASGLVRTVTTTGTRPVVSDSGQNAPERWPIWCEYRRDDAKSGEPTPEATNNKDRPRILSRLSFRCRLDSSPVDVTRSLQRICEAYFFKTTEKQSMTVRKLIKTSTVRILTANANSIEFTEAGFVKWLEENYLKLCSEPAFNIDPVTAREITREGKILDFRAGVQELIGETIKPAQAKPNPSP